MKKILFTLLAPLLTLSLLAPLALAQDKPLKLALVNTQALLAAHPAGQQAAALAQQRDTDLKPLIEELTTLQGKSQTAEGLTPDERARATLIVKTIEDTRNRYTVDIGNAAAPAEEAINAALKAVSEANGYTLVIDGDLAGYAGLRLFVYVDSASIPDITEQVIAQMNAQ
jgi:Skp family chaperone for outer membrane proteins